MNICVPSSFLTGRRLLPCFNGVDVQGFIKKTPRQAQERETTTGGCLCPQQGPDGGFRVKGPGQGPLKLLFACAVKIICVSVIYNRERSVRKIFLPIDFSRFLCHLRGVPRNRGIAGFGEWPPEIMNPAVYTNSVYFLLLNKFYRRLQRGGNFHFLCLIPLRDV